MMDKELKKLSRKDLLEMLIEQSKEVERLRAALAESEARANSREIGLQNAGSIAEAALSVSGVFEAAEAAAQQYLENIRRCSEGKEAIYNRIVGEAEAKAAAILEEAEKEKEQKQKEAFTYWKDVSRKLEAFYQEHQGLREMQQMEKNRA